MSETLRMEELKFLARLPIHLNSSLDTKTVIAATLRNVSNLLDVEGATVFLKDRDGKALSFWAIEGEKQNVLADQSIPLGKGIVGWVVENAKPALVSDVGSDPRFFSAIDKDTGFKTRDTVCVPLIVDGSTVVGAIQVINSKGTDGFSERDLLMLEHVAAQVSLAIQNAQLFESAEQMARKLAILDRRKGEMLSVLAHEFRTPLTLVQSAADLLVSGPPPNEETSKNIGQTIRRGSERITKLLKQVKNASAAEGALQTQREVFDVNHLLNDVVSLYRERLGKREIEIKNAGGAGEILVDADSSLIRIVLNNLVANAIRFTPDGGTVELAALGNAERVVISVKDSGIGIEPSHHQLIFEKFFEVTDAMHHSSGDLEFKSAGLGLGLATSKAILASHASTIQVDSALGKGSEFSFELPSGKSNKS